MTSVDSETGIHVRSLIQWVMICVLALLSSSALASEKPVFDWMPPSVAYEGFLFLPKAHFSSDNGAGAGLQAVRPFRHRFTAESGDDSELKLKGRLNTDGHGAFEARLTTYFGDGNWSVNARIDYASLVRRFWGIGPDLPDSAEEAFRSQDLFTYFELYRRVRNQLGLGLRLEWQDFHYVETEFDGLLSSEAYRGVDRGNDNVVGAGAVFEWDARNSRYAPSSGWYISGYSMFFVEKQGGDHRFSNWHLDSRKYWSPGAGVTVAGQIFVFAADGDVPIWRLAQLGGRTHSRGYRRGRFTEKKLVTSQIELRRHMFWRLGGVAFAGVATVARSVESFSIDHVRPTLGGGLRIRVGDREDVLVRADLAAGTGSLRAYFSFGHAF